MQYIICIFNILMFYRCLTVMCLKTRTDLRLLFLYYKYLLYHRDTIPPFALYALDIFTLH